MSVQAQVDRPDWACEKSMEVVKSQYLSQLKVRGLLFRTVELTPLFT